MSKRSLYLLLGLLAVFGLSFLPLGIAAPLLYALRLALIVAASQLALKPLHLPRRFFIVLGSLVVFLALGMAASWLLVMAQVALFLFLALVVVDAILLFHPKIKLKAARKLPKLFSLSDPNPIKLELDNQSPVALSLEIIDELPLQFQKRDFQLFHQLQKGEKDTLVYELKPLERGEYVFRNINIFLRSKLGLIERHIIVEQEQTIPVYPSIIQMRKYELLALARISIFPGVKKMRRLGNSYEFEQIRNYVKGDDFRSINWKATSRRNELMVNQYEDERSQQVFCVIDKGRSMKMPFEGLSLMDYAINSSLVILNIALQKHDKAGLMSFSDKIGSTVKAESGPKHLRTILEALYREKERNFEANYELLFQASRRFIRRRSLIFLYTNFESFSAMQRVLPILRRINHLHLLVVVFFENTEIQDYAKQEAHDTEMIYNRTIAQKFVEEKQRIVRELRQYGIQSILTRPEDLSINTVNKYLELKARGLI